MKITAKTLQSLGACADQLARFEELYPEGIEVTEENIRAANAEGLDVFFVIFQILPRAAAIMCLCDVAEHVLPVFETARPGDPRVRECIEITRRYAAGEASKDEVKKAARAAWAASWVATRASWYAWAATRAASGAWAAAWAAWYAEAADAAKAAGAVSADAGDAAGDAGDAAADAAEATRDAERAWQVETLCRYYREEEA